MPADARPGWRVLRALGGQLGLPGFEFIDLAELRAGIVERLVASGNGIAAVANANAASTEIGDPPPAGAVPLPAPVA